MKKAVPMLAALLAFAGCAEAPRREAVSVEMAWVRLPAAPGRPGAAYFVLRGGARPTRLVRISRPQAQRAEMHGPGMQALGPQAVVAECELVFRPGGRHVMLYGLDPGLRPTSLVTLDFHFDSVPDLTTRVPVVQPGFPDPTFPATQPGSDPC